MLEHPALEDACSAQSRTQGLIPGVDDGDMADVVDVCAFARIGCMAAMARNNEHRCMTKRGGNKKGRDEDAGLRVLRRLRYLPVNW